MAEQNNITEDQFKKYVDNMSPSQAANFSANLNRMSLNRNQELLATPYSGSKPYNYVKPDGIGGALRNIGSNLLRPQMERLGLRPSIKGQLANMQYDQMVRDNAQTRAEKARDQILREELIAKGVADQTVAGLYGKGLADFATKVQGVVTNRLDGSSYTQNPLTNVQTQIIEPSDEEQEYNNYKRNLVAPNIALNPQEYRAQGDALKTEATDRAAGKVIADNFYSKYRREQTVLFADSVYANGKSSQNGLMNQYMMRDLIGSEGLEQGALSPFMVTGKALMMDMGFDFEGDLNEETLFRSMSNKLAMLGRSTADGGGMPGSMSDGDRIFLVDMVPNLRNVPGGNALIIESMIALSERNIAIRDEQDRYLKEKGTLDGIEQHLDKKFRDKEMLKEIRAKADRLLNPGAANDGGTVTTR